MIIHVYYLYINIYEYGKKYKNTSWIAGCKVQSVH